MLVRGVEERGGSVLRALSGLALSCPSNKRPPPVGVKPKKKTKHHKQTKNFTLNKRLVKTIGRAVSK